MREFGRKMDKIDDWGVSAARPFLENVGMEQKRARRKL